MLCLHEKNRPFVLALGSTVLLDLLCIALVFTLSGIALKSSSFIFFDNYYLRVFTFTLFQALVGSFLSILFALLSVFSLRRIQTTVVGGFFTQIINLPFFIPSLVGCLSLILMFGQNGMVSNCFKYIGLSYNTFVYGVGGIILCHVFYYTPFALRIFNKTLDLIQPEYNRLSQQLGFSRFDRFKSIEWPFLKNDLLSTFGIVFMYCLRSFTTVLILGGTPKSTTLEVSIFQAINFEGDLEAASQLALAQFLTTISFLGFFQMFKNPLQSTKPPLQKEIFKQKIKTNDVLFILLATFFFLSPLLLVFFDGFNKKIGTLLISEEFWQALNFSLLIGFFTAGISFFLAISLIYSSIFMEKKNKFKKTLSFLIELASNSSILFSSTILGTAIYFLFFDRIKNPSFVFGVIVFLNGILFLPNIVRILKTPFQVQYFRYERLCQLLEIKGFERWRKIDWPLLREPLGYALLTCLVFSLGDAKTILFLNPSFENLTSLLYRKMSLHDFEEAASLATLLIVISFLIAFGIKRIFRGKNINYDQT